jgi:hypothetical protein
LTVANTSGSDSVSRTVSVSSPSSIIPSDRLIDWSKAGVWDVRYNTKGIPTYPVGINLTGLTSYGGYPLDNKGVTDSRNAINAALTACPNYQAVLLGPGSYRIGPSGGLSIPSYKVLRGTEPFTVTPLTTLILDHGVADGVNAVSFSASGTGYTPVVNIISCAKGSDTVTVGSVSGFSVGDQVIVDELNDPDLVDISDVDFPTTGCTWCSRDNGARALGEVKIIKAINTGARTMQFERPLYRSYWNSPQVCRDVAVGNRKINAGVESLMITSDGSAPGQNCDAIDFMRASYCWAKRVETRNIHYKNIILQYYNIGCEIRECFTHGVPATYSRAGNYSIVFMRQNTDCLVEDNILYHVHSGIALGSGGSTANVLAYNFILNEHHDTQSNWFLGGTGHHGAHPYMNLWEGNYARKLFHDTIHGSSSHSVWFRNKMTGYPVSTAEWEEDPNQPTVTQEMAVCNIPAITYYISVVGNILGTEDFQTVYETYPISLTTKQIWKVGTASQNSQGGQTDFKTVSTLLRHGNYDYVTHSTVWDPGISDHALPYSLYLAAKPVFFGGLSWPAFGPDLSPIESNIPAKYRFDAGTYFSGPPAK